MIDQGIQSNTIQDYVLQQARQRAFQIGIQGLKQYEKQKQRLFSQKKSKLDEQFQARRRKQTLRKKIQNSTKISNSRIAKMIQRQTKISQLIVQVQNQVINKIKDDQYYKEFLRQLILQGILKMGQKKVLIKVIQKDIRLVKIVVQQVIRQYQQMVKVQKLQLPQHIEVVVDQNNCLQQRNLGKVQEGSYFINKGDQDKYCVGGVVVCSQNGLIVCKNTIDVRMQSTYQQSLPDVRKLLFPS